MQLPCARGERVQHAGDVVPGGSWQARCILGFKHVCDCFAKVWRQILLCGTFERHFRRHRDEWRDCGNLPFQNGSGRAAATNAGRSGCRRLTTRAGTGDRRPRPRRRPCGNRAHPPAVLQAPGWRATFAAIPARRTTSSGLKLVLRGTVLVRGRHGGAFVQCSKKSKPTAIQGKHAAWHRH
jgi:hypothetical protein